MRFGKMIFGFILIAIGIFFAKYSGLGLSPWDVMNDGVANALNITLGQSSILVGIAFLVFDFIMHERLGYGTVLNILLVGTFYDILVLINDKLGLFSMCSGISVQSVIYVLIGIPFLCLGICLYIIPCLGAGPRDSVMIGLARRLPISVGTCRIFLEAAAVLIGWLLGGAIGLGTLMAVLFNGPVMQFFFKVLKFDAKKSQNQSFKEVNAIVLDFLQARK